MWNSSEDPEDFVPDPEAMLDEAIVESGRWIKEVTYRDLSDPKDLQKSLSNGVLLCELLIALKRGCVKRPNRYASKENLKEFFRGCEEELGLDPSTQQIFSADDLQSASRRLSWVPSSVSATKTDREKLKSIVTTIYWISEAAAQLPSYSGPKLDTYAFESVIFGIYSPREEPKREEPQGEEPPREEHQLYRRDQEENGSDSVFEETGETRTFFDIPEKIEYKEPAWKTALKALQVEDDLETPVKPSRGVDAESTPIWSGRNSDIYSGKNVTTDGKRLSSSDDVDEVVLRQPSAVRLRKMERKLGKKTGSPTTTKPHSRSLSLPETSNNAMMMRQNALDSNHNSATYEDIDEEDSDMWRSSFNSWKMKRNVVASSALERKAFREEVDELEQNKGKKKPKTFREIVEEKQKRENLLAKKSMKKQLEKDEIQAILTSVDLVPSSESEEEPEPEQEPEPQIQVETRQEQHAPLEPVEKPYHNQPELASTFPMSGRREFPTTTTTTTAASEPYKPSPVPASSTAASTSSKPPPSVAPKPKYRPSAGAFQPYRRSSSLKEGADLPDNDDSHTHTSTSPTETALSSHTYPARSFHEKIFRDRQLDLERAEMAKKNQETARRPKPKRMSMGIMGRVAAFNSGDAFKKKGGDNDEETEGSSSSSIVQPTQSFQESGSFTEHAIIMQRRPRAQGGFGFTVTGGIDKRKPIVVKGIDPGSTAGLSALKIGDEIIMINNERTKTFDHDDIQYSISQAVLSGHLELKVKRYNDANTQLRSPSTSSASSTGISPTRRDEQEEERRWEEERRRREEEKRAEERRRQEEEQREEERRREERRRREEERLREEQRREEERRKEEERWREEQRMREEEEMERQRRQREEEQARVPSSRNALSKAKQLLDDLGDDETSSEETPRHDKGQAFMNGNSALSLSESESENNKPSVDSADGSGPPMGLLSPSPSQSPSGHPSPSPPPSPVSSLPLSDTLPDTGIRPDTSSPAPDAFPHHHGNDGEDEEDDDGGVGLEEEYEKVLRDSELNDTHGTEDSFFASEGTKDDDVSSQDERLEEEIMNKLQMEEKEEDEREELHRQIEDDERDKSPIKESFITADLQKTEESAPPSSTFSGKSSGFRSVRGPKPFVTKVKGPEPFRPQPAPSLTSTTTQEDDVRERVKKDRSDFFRKDSDPKDMPVFGYSADEDSQVDDNVENLWRKVEQPYEETAPSQEPLGSSGGVQRRAKKSDLDPSNRRSFNLDEERQRLEKWQKEQERLRQEQYEQEQRRLQEEQEKDLQRAEYEARRKQDMEQRALLERRRMLQKKAQEELKKREEEMLERERKERERRRLEQLAREEEEERIRKEEQRLQEEREERERLEREQAEREEAARRREEELLLVRRRKEEERRAQEKERQRIREEREARERKAREKIEKEKQEYEQLLREREEERERLAREQDERQRAIWEQEERQRAAKKEEERRAAKEREERQRAAKEREARLQAAVEQEEKEKSRYQQPYAGEVIKPQVQQHQESAPPPSRQRRQTDEDILQRIREEERERIRQEERERLRREWEQLEQEKQEQLERQRKEREEIERLKREQAELQREREKLAIQQQEELDRLAKQRELYSKSMNNVFEDDEVERKNSYNRRKQHGSQDDLRKPFSSNQLGKDTIEGKMLPERDQQPGKTFMARHKDENIPTEQHWLVEEAKRRQQGPLVVAGKTLNSLPIHPRKDSLDHEPVLERKVYNQEHAAPPPATMTSSNHNNANHFEKDYGNKEPVGYEQEIPTRIPPPNRSQVTPPRTKQPTHPHEEPSPSSSSDNNRWDAPRHKYDTQPEFKHVQRRMHGGDAADRKQKMHNRRSMPDLTAEGQGFTAPVARPMDDQLVPHGPAQRGVGPPSPRHGQQRGPPPPHHGGPGPGPGGDQRRQGPAPDSLIQPHDHRRPSPQSPPSQARTNRGPPSSPQGRGPPRQHQQQQRPPPQHGPGRGPPPRASAFQQPAKKPLPGRSVSGKVQCSNCGKSLGRGAAMIIESVGLHFHLECFRCCVCNIQLGNGTKGTDVRIRASKLHCQNCYSNDAGFEFTEV